MFVSMLVSISVFDKIFMLFVRKLKIRPNIGKKTNYLLEKMIVDVKDYGYLTRRQADPRASTKPNASIRNKSVPDIPHIFSFVVNRFKETQPFIVL